ncbi:sigma-70 family RNA polymerase sigma factor [Alicyclobacillus sp.]|uniref:RNA polymerase sigma factor n=1 Tax=Alicyclobacillus sp. TaxID=61169 RepID=UPI0025BC83E8|nr:sigma-70 family RNA polymerase sigma factor [Alicyclobacillus sp.]MCL6515686.1 sigma-70 family RNA polymerase sigma factor [Alicyclobacillus sp.]
MQPRSVAMGCYGVECHEPFCAYGCFREHAAMVRHLVYHITRDPNDVEDLTQEIMLKAYRSLDGYRGGSFRAWLARIARNHCYDVLRRRQTDDLPLADEVLATVEPGPEDVVVWREAVWEVAQAINRLPPVDREILLLRHVHQFSYDEIAAAVNMRPGAVRTRVVRARRKLADLVDGREIRETPELG